MRPDITRTHRKRVVIVDDSKTMQAVLDQILSLRLGLDVVGIASDAETAVSLVRSLRPDLVTIDLLMPYIDGCRLLEMLDDLTDVRKVVISGTMNDNLAVVTRLQQAGADACIDKRTMCADPTAFCAKIMSILSKPKYVKRGSGADPAAGLRLIETTPPVPVGQYPIPLDERARLEVLCDSGLLDDRLDVGLDLLTEHMAITSGFPTCLLNFLDRDTQWVKSAYGFERGRMERSLAFCNYTLCADDAVVVPNATADVRFARNPLVTGEPRIRTYVGCPIVSGSGVRLGAMCLIDTKPRRITPNLVESLRSMSRIASDVIQRRSDSLARAA